MARVVFTPTARDHLRNLRAYIARDSPSAATRMARRIRTEAARLADFPLMGRVVLEYEDPSIRELIVAPDRVVYRIEAERDSVHVVGIIHAARLFPRTVAEF